LVPLYIETDWQENIIYENNKWIKNFLINFPMKSIINMPINKSIWNNYHKKIWEKILWGKIGNFVEKFIKSIWLPIVVWKIKKLGEKAKWVFISDDVLKFHWNDIRSKLKLKYKLKKES
jgi:hypothetical protein